MIVSVGLEGRRHFLECRCDECNILFVAYRYVLRRRKFHFCSRTCSNESQKSGVLMDQVVATNRERFGCDYPTQNKKVMDKQRTTNLNLYGKETNRHIGLERFLRERGIINPSQLPDHREKVRQTSLQKYGVEHPSQANEVKIKIQTTNLERYGVNWVLSSPEVMKFVDWHMACIKRHEAMKKNGTYFKGSKSEDCFYSFLCDSFGADDVKRNVLVFGWDIDFYIQSINTYIQFDGVYWHGLDRSINEILESKSPRDKVILSTIKRDERQNETFLSNGLRLIRILDKEFDAKCRSGKLASIVGKIKGNEE